MNTTLAWTPVLLLSEDTSIKFTPVGTLIREIGEKKKNW